MHILPILTLGLIGFVFLTYAFVEITRTPYISFSYASFLNVKIGFVLHKNSFPARRDFAPSTMLRTGTFSGEACLVVVFDDFELMFWPPFLVQLLFVQTPRYKPHVKRGAK